jgi:flagellar M-ring protein FliF
MPVELGKIVEQAKALWQKLSMPRRIALGVVVAAVAIGIAVLALRPETKDETVLFAGLAPEDAGVVVERLKAEKVPYSLDAGGTAILVPTTRVHELRLTLASAGVPRGGGVGFEVFDKQAFGATSFVEKMNYHRALSGELARSVMSLADVEHARVHIAQPQQSLYAKQEEPPSASVLVRMRPGRALSREQVRGIVHLVTSSVQRLAPDAVSIVDEGGKTLWPDDEAQGTRDERKVLEQQLRERVAAIVERIVGPGRSEVSVTAELDHSYTEQTEEIFDKDRAAVRSTQRNEEVATGEANAPTGGVAGARGNLPGTAPADQTNGANGANGANAGSGANGPERRKTSETVNNEISRTLRKVLGPKSQIKRLHVAVLVDGWEQPLAEAHLAALASSREAMRLAVEATARAETSSVATASTSTTTLLADKAPAKKDEKPKLPKKMRIRSATELASIAGLVSKAAGLDSRRGDEIEVHAIPFHDQQDIDEPEATAPGPLDRLTKVELAAVAAGLTLLLAIGALAGVLALKRKKRPPEIVVAETLPVLPLTAAEADRALSDEPPPAPEVPAETPEEVSIRELAIELARQNPEKAARILALWLSDPHGAPAAHLPPPAQQAQAAGEARPQGARA